MTADYATIPSAFQIKDTLPLLVEHQHPYFVIIDESGPLGVVDRRVLIQNIHRKCLNRNVSTLIIQPASVLEGNKPAVAAWENLPPETDRIVPVLLKGQLSGVVSRDVIIEYLALHANEAAVQEVFS